MSDNMHSVVYNYYW